jgi:hypothetical protein
MLYPLTPATHELAPRAGFEPASHRLTAERVTAATIEEQNWLVLEDSNLYARVQSPLHCRCVKDQFQIRAAEFPVSSQDRTEEHLVRRRKRLLTQLTARAASTRYLISIYHADRVPGGSYHRNERVASHNISVRQTSNLARDNRRRRSWWEARDLNPHSLASEASLLSLDEPP